VVFPDRGVIPVQHVVLGVRAPALVEKTRDGIEPRVVFLAFCEVAVELEALQPAQVYLGHRKQKSKEETADVRARGRCRWWPVAAA